MPYRPQVDYQGPDPGYLSSYIDDAFNSYYGIKEFQESQKDREQVREDRKRQQEVEDFRFRAEVEGDPRYTTNQPVTARARGDVLDTRGIDNLEHRSASDILGGSSPRIGMGQRDRQNPALKESAMRGMGQPPREAAVHDQTSGVFQGLRDNASEMASRGGGKPRVLPGQFVPGMGYSPAAIYDEPAPDPFRFEEERAAPIASVSGMDIYNDPRYVPPDVQEERDQQELVGLFERARSGDRNAQNELAVRDRLLADVAVRPEELTVKQQIKLVGRAEGGDKLAMNELMVRYPGLYDDVKEEQEPEYFTSTPRFEDTPAGRQEALGWRRQWAAAGRAPGTSSSGGDDISDDRVLDYAMSYALQFSGSGDRPASTITPEGVDAAIQDLEAQSPLSVAEEAVLEALYDLRSSRRERGFLGIGQGGGGASSTTTLPPPSGGR